MNIENETKKLVILGSGPAGLTAGIYSARFGLKPIILEGKTPGGQLMTTTFIENWPGEKRILGSDLIKNLKEHAISLGCEIISQEAKEINLKERPFQITTNKHSIYAQSIIIATGTLPRKLNCPGESTYWGKGVSTCAVCDGPFFKDKPVVIVGGGDTSMENALFMRNYTNDITIVHILSKLTASQIMQDKVLSDPNIKIIYNSKISEILGDDNKVTNVKIVNNISNEQTEKEISGVFIAIGLLPNTNIFKNQIDLDKYGYIITKNNTSTSVDGVFAAGDVADPNYYKQAITAAGTGCMAAIDAFRYLDK